MKEKMKIFVVGTGRIGGALAERLSKEGYDITIIDKDENVVESISTSVDAIGYQGNGASLSTLQELNAKDADMLLAVTDSDELNFLTCFTAHSMGVKHTIARIREFDYAEHSHFYKDKLGISMLFNPDLASASEIFRILRFPSATRIELFAGGKAELVELDVSEDSELVGKSLIEISKGGINLLICAIVRSGDVFVPKGNTVIESGDKLYLTGSQMEFTNSFRRLKLSVKPLKSVMIYGNDRMTFYLAQLLSRVGTKVTVVDSDEVFCKKMADALPKISVMNDDAFRYFDNMSESDLKNTDAFVAISTNDENNLIAAMYAETKGVSKVASRIGSRDRMKVLADNSKINVVFKEDVAADRVLGYIRAIINAETNDAVESLYRFLDGKLEFVEFKVKSDDKNLNVPLKDLKINKNMLLAGIIRRNVMIIPHGADSLQAGDTAIVATINSQIGRLEDLYE